MEIVMRNNMSNDVIELFDYQQDALDVMDLYDNNIFITSRQLGMTTVVLYKAITYVVEGKKVLYTTISRNQGRNILCRMRDILEGSNINFNITGTTITIGEGSFTIDADDREFDVVFSDGVAIPEVRFNKSMVIMYPYQSISEIIGKCDKRFNIEILKYDVVPERDDVWRDTMIRSIGIECFNREYLG